MGWLEKAKAALSTLPHGGSEGSSAEKEDDCKEAIPQMKCYRCSQTQYFDPCSTFVQVILRLQCVFIKHELLRKENISDRLNPCRFGG